MGRTQARSGRLDLDLDDRLPVPALELLARLVGGHRDEPRLEPVGVVQRGKLPPGDPPGRLRGVLGHALVAADHEGDPHEVEVVRSDDPREGDLVARDGALHRGGDRGAVEGEACHATEIPIGHPTVPSWIRLDPGTSAVGPFQNASAAARSTVWQPEPDDRGRPADRARLGLRAMARGRAAPGRMCAQSGMRPPATKLTVPTSHWRWGPLRATQPSTLPVTCRATGKADRQRVPEVVPDACIAARRMGCRGRGRVPRDRRHHSAR